MGRKARWALAFSCLTLLPQIPLFAAGSVTLAWDPSPDASVTGYRIYYGPTSASYTNSTTVGTVTNATLTNLVQGATYFFAATAFDSANLESDFSNETTYTVPTPSTNQPPTLNAISGVTLSEDASLQTVSLGGISSGSVNETQTLTVTATSSNPGLIPNPTVSYTSPNTTGNLSFTPVANANGTATITVVVNDGQSVNNTVTRTFAITVNAVNDAPTLAALGSVTINEDAGAQTVGLSGIGTGAANESQPLAVTATSSNPSLIPNPTVNYSSPNATGSLVYTPVANGSGVATITVTVSDAQAVNGTVVQTFTVTVNAVNDAPTLAALNNLNLAENAGLQSVSLTGISSGAVNESQTLVVTATSSNPGLIPNPTVSYTSPNTTGSLNFTPVANANGTATITVTVNDGQGVNNTVVQTFTVNVNLANIPPTLAALSNVTIAEDASAQTVNLSGISSGSVNENQTLSVTATSSNPGLIANPTVNYTSPSTTGSLSFTPTANSNGTATITVTVNDGHAVSNTLSRTFTVTVNAVNDAPTLAALGSVTINEDAGAQTVGLSGIGTGAANESQPLAVTATSSNPSLIPNPTVNYSSPNVTGSLVYTPVANGSGVATITVTVSDAQAVNGTVVQTFTVTVNAVNDAPTLNNINPLTIVENVGLQTVTLGGIGTGAANESQTLTITAVSSDPSVIPNPVVNYSSPNTSGNLTFTPVPNVNGTATITVTLNDGQSSNNTVSRTFAVTVTPVNSAPTITAIPGQTVVSGSSSALINFTIGDVETPAASLALSASSSAPGLLPVANIVFGGSGSNRTVRVTPVSGQTGNATVTLTVNDGAATASASFLVTVQEQTSQLSINKTGSGTITPDLSGTALVVGQSYTLTATPAAGYEFAGWSGGIQSSSPTLTFTMTAGLVLQANFVASPYVAAAGTYNGLFNETDEVRVSSAGAFSIYADTSGNYSGWVQLGYARHTVSGQLQLDSRATNVVTRWNTTPLTVELRFGQNGEAGQIFGRVSDGVWTASLSGGRAAYQTVGGAPQAGDYTVVFPGQVGDPNLPAGDSYGTLHLGADGLGTLNGTLADGTAFSQTAWLTTEGDWPLYVSLYGGKGVVVSWMTFTNQASSDINGAVVWIKQANPAATLYPAGFISDTKAVGSVYVAPTGANKVVNLSSASVSFTGGNLAADFSNAVSVNAGSQVVNLSPNALTFAISTTLGSFSGQVTEPGTGAVYPFSGVVLQKQNAGFGFLPGSSRSSRVTLAAP